MVLALPYVASADNAGVKSNVFNPTILRGPLLICVGASGTNGGNQLPVCNNVCDLVAQIANVIYYAIAVILWIITPIMIAVGGIMIMLGGANSEMIGRGKKTITGAVWSIVIVLCAWLIIATFLAAMGNLSNYIGGFGGTSVCSVSS